jgi:hypothetical protein
MGGYKRCKGRLEKEQRQNTKGAEAGYEGTLKKWRKQRQATKDTKAGLHSAEAHKKKRKHSLKKHKGRQ